MISPSMAQTFFKVLAPQEALKILLGVTPVGEEQLPSVKARGRVLAEDLHSAVDLPHFYRAAMDGYAVKAKDTFGSSRTTTVCRWRISQMLRRPKSRWS
jgi:molybdopterin molybdotransferase